MANIKDVAARANVAPATVSRILNNDPSLSIRADTRLRVLQCVEELGYRPNHAARSLKVKSTRTIAVVIPSFVFPIHMEIVRGIEHAANRAGYRVLVGSTEHEDENRLSYLDILGKDRVDGVIIADGFMEDDKIARFARKGVPYVLVSKRRETDSYIVLDDKNGARAAVEQFIGRGHRRIGIISGSLHVDDARERLQGYKEALHAHRLPWDPELAVEANFTRDCGYRGMERLLALADPPTAVFAGNLNMGVGAYMKLKEVQSAPARPVALMCFHDHDFVTGPIGLSAVGWPVYDMGVRSVEMLVDIINDERLPPQQHIIREYRLTLRESTL